MGVLEGLWSRNPGVLGRAASLPEGVRIYAVGDIHGRADLVDKIFLQIDRDRAQRPIGTVIEIFLGDYIDRGPDSMGVIERLLQRGHGRNVVTLAGNHEQMLLNVLERPDEFAIWARNGGLETLRSYGALPPLVNAATDRLLVEWFRQALPGSHLRFLKSLGDSFSSGDYFFAHAGVRPGVPLLEQRREDLLWIRDGFTGSDVDFGAVIVHGHTPVEEVEFRANRINIDTGAYMTDILSCLVLEGTWVWLLE